MPFQQDGFLSKDLGSWIARVRSDNAEWFSLLDDLNRAAVAALFSIQPSKERVDELVAALLLARSIQSFEACVLLSERGMMADARTSVRSLTESAIALGAIAHDPTFYDELIASSDKHRAAVGNAFLNGPAARDEFTEQQIASLRAMVAEIGAEYGGKPNEINWAEVASRIGITSIYNTVYRDMSGDGAHATIDGLNRHLKANEDREIQHLLFEPTSADLGSTFSASV